MFFSGNYESFKIPRRGAEKEAEIDTSTINYKRLPSIVVKPSKAVTEEDYTSPLHRKSNNNHRGRSYQISPDRSQAGSPERRPDQRQNNRGRGRGRGNNRRSTRWVPRDARQDLNRIQAERHQTECRGRGRDQPSSKSADKKIQRLQKVSESEN